MGVVHNKNLTVGRARKRKQEEQRQQINQSKQSEPPAMNGWIVYIKTIAFDYGAKCGNARDGCADMTNIAQGMRIRCDGINKVLK